MALDQETINNQLAQLALQRQRLALLLQQQAKLGVYTPPYVLIDIQEAQSAIGRIKEQLRDGNVSIKDEPNDNIQPIAPTNHSQLSPKEQRNRRAMLTKVKTIWINGLLEQSLAKELRIVLELATQPNAVELPLNALVQELNQPSHTLPAGTPVIDVFDQMGGALLVLGAPGAGKTTLLLELTRDLIARAEGDENFPIPVVFNLSSWASKRQPLKEWLAEELNTKYDVPRKVAQTWINTDAILPLLDGLDEVTTNSRNECVQAINIYRQDDGLLPLAVCSRLAEYESITVRLRLQGAIVAQPLTQQQADVYLEHGGEKLISMRTALRNDTQFGELLDTPLMIHIAALAYKDKLLSELQSKETPNQQWKYLLDAYIEAMFRRRSKEIRYTQRQIKYYLSWLARQMIQHNQVVYFFERMQPTWLTHQQQQKYIFYICLLNGVVVGFAVGLFFALFLGLSGGLIGGLIGGLVGAIQARFWGEILIAEAFDWSAVWIELDDGLSDGLGFGLIVGLGFGLISSLSDGPLFGLIGSLIVGVGVGLGCGLTFGLAGALAIVLGSDLTGIGIDARKMTKQDFDQAMHNAFVGCLIGGLVGMLSGWFVDGFPTALVGALAGMLLVGLNYGGRAIIQLLTLRWLLSQNGIIPFCNRDLTTFLDYCAERIFLRKVGGGYMFIHRLLMEHFAAMYNEESGKATLK